MRGVAERQATAVLGWVRRRGGTRIAATALLAVAGLCADAAGVTLSADPQRLEIPVGGPALIETGLALQAREDQRRTSDARARRARTRTAYRRMSDADARLLAEQAFPQVYRQRPWRAEVKERTGFLRWAGRHGAVLGSDDGGRSLVMSTLPLRTENAAGELETADTQLVARGGGFEPRNGPVDVRVSSQISGGVTFEALGMRVRPVGLEAEAPGRPLGPTITWENVAPDTDFSVTTSAIGAQTFHQLRSAESPERLEMRVDLPDGAALEPVAGGREGFRVVRGGEPAAAIMAPTAVDAEGVSVSVSAVATADGFALEVHHRDSVVTYPVLVDPVIVEQRWGLNGQATYKGWSEVVQPNNGGAFSRWREASPRGLYVASIANRWYNEGDWSGWGITAPTNTTLTEVEMSHMIFTDGGARMCVEQGFAGNPTLWDANASWRDGLNQAGWGAWSHCMADFWGHWVRSFPRAGTTTGNTFMMHLRASLSFQRSAAAQVYAQGAQVVINDAQPPTAPTLSGLPANGWSGPARMPTATATDPGLGMAGLRVLEGTTTRSFGEQTSCTSATIAAPNNETRVCAGTLSAKPLPVPTGEGAVDLKVWGMDVVGNEHGPRTNVRLHVDRTAPTGQVSGSLKAAGWTANRGDVHSLTIAAADARSGVADIQVSIDGRPVAPADYRAPTCPSAPGTCPPTLSRTVSIDTAALTFGTHRITASVRDAASNTTVLLTLQPFQVVDTAAPTVALSGPAAQPLAPGGRLDMTATDGTAGSGVDRLTVQVDGGTPVPYDRPGCPQTASTCPLTAWTQPHTVDPASLSEGLHTVKVVARDKRGNTGTATTTLYNGPLPAMIRLDQVQDAARWTTPLLANGWSQADPRRWVDAYQGSYRATAAGLGLKTLRLKEPRPAGDADREQGVRSSVTHQPCDASTSSPCPLLLPDLLNLADNDVPYDTGRWKEGIVRPSMVVLDQGGAVSNEYPRPIRDPRIEMAVDHEEPTIITTGSLAAFEGKAVTTPHGAADPLLLEILATDGVAGDDESLWRSGVKSTQIDIAKNIGYGQPESAWTWTRYQADGEPNPDCADEGPQMRFANCQQRRTVTVNTDEYGEGLHAIRITAKDRLAVRQPAEHELDRRTEHIATKTFYFYVDFSDPTVDGGTVQHGLPLDTWVNDQTLTVSADAADQGTGVANGVVTYPVRAGGTGPAKSPLHIFGGTADCRVSANPAERCPQTTRATVSYEGENIAEGAAVPVSLAINDGIAKTSAAAANPTWTLRVDHTPPAWSSGLGASGGASTTGHGSLTWDIAADPRLADGAEGSGTAGYVVRYTRNGGPVTEANAGLPEIVLTGTQIGESIHLEVQARDWAGNLSTPVTADFTLGAFDGCDPAIPATCESDDSLMEEDEEDPPVQLEAPDSSSLRSSYDAKRYPLVTAKENCRNRRCWATIRSYAHSWAVGNTRIVHTETSPAEVPRETIRRSDVRTDNEGYEWFLGNLTWIGGKCGWVRVDPPYEGPIEDASSDCPPGQNWKWFDWTFPSDKKSRGNNCFERRSTPQPGTGRYWSALPINRCTQGTAMKLLHGTVVCANVGLLPDGRTSGCAERDVIDRIGEIESLDYCVNWRYITRDGQWVMVRHDDRVRSNEHGGWSFIRRKALPSDRMEWPGRFDRPTCKNWDGKE